MHIVCCQVIRVFSEVDVTLSASPKSIFQNNVSPPNVCMYIGTLRGCNGHSLLEATVEEGEAELSFLYYEDNLTTRTIGVPCEHPLFGGSTY